MGNEEGYLMLRKSDIISIELSESSFYESQLVNGSLKLECSDEVIINEINIKIRMLQSFIILKLNAQNITNFSQDDIFSEKLDLHSIFGNKNSENNKISKGIHQIPFNFFLPSKLLPSFEFPKMDNKSFIRYILTVELTVGNKKHITEEFLRICQRPFNIPSPIKYSDIKIIKSPGLISKGESCINLLIASCDLRINDPLKFGIEIDNTKCELNVKAIQIKIIRIITYIKGDEKITFRKEIINKKYPFKCLKGEKNNVDFNDIILRDDDLKDMSFKGKLNPYLGTIDDVNLLMPSLEATFIKCEYQLNASPLYESIVLDKDSPTINIPIYAIHQSLLEYEGDKLIIENQKENLSLGKNINKISDQIIPGIGSANPYIILDNNYPTYGSIINVEKNKGNNNNNGNNNYNNGNNNLNNNGNNNNINGNKRRFKGYIKYEDLFP